MPDHIIPSIGRIVLHVGRDGQIRPAIVTHVHGPVCININVFPKDGSDTNAGIKTSVMHAERSEDVSQSETWHWMPYQKQQAAAWNGAHATPTAP